MSIELLIKLHAPKAVSIEAESQCAGRSPDGVGREAVLAALAHAERQHPVGVMVLAPATCLMVWLYVSWSAATQSAR